MHTPRSSDRTTLDLLPPGTRGIVSHAEGVDSTILRLVEMGLTEGVAVVVTRRAPLGGAVEVQVRGTRLCMRRNHARCFVVDPVDAGQRDAAHPA